MPFFSSWCMSELRFAITQQQKSALMGPLPQVLATLVVLAGVKNHWPKHPLKHRVNPSLVNHKRHTKLGLVTFCIELRVQNLIGLQRSMLLPMASFQYIYTAWIWGESGIFSSHNIKVEAVTYRYTHLVLGRDSFIHIWRVIYYALLRNTPQ